MAASPFHFTRLARELRDMIYVHYVTIDGGYVFNPESWKLKSNSKDDAPNPHPFGLQLTCKLVASEMTGLALSHNLITFMPIEAMRERAFRFEILVEMYFQAAQYTLRRLMKELEWQMPESTKERLLPHCPTYLHRDLSGGLFKFNSESRDASWPWSDPPAVAKMWADRYVAPSERLAFVQRLMQQPEFAQFFDPEFVGLDLFNQTWKMPSHAEIDKLFAMLFPLVSNHHDDSESSKNTPKYFKHGHEYHNYFIYRFSAAAAAIGFLESLKPSTRLHIRNILLSEDRESVANPERHGKGLVPFCDENPLLRIERRLSFWEALLPISIRNPSIGSGRSDNWYSSYRSEKDGTWYRNRWWERDAKKDSPRAGFGVSSGSSVVDTVATWALEALSLPSSISLVIDGDPLPERSSQVFGQFIVRDAVWHAALERSLSSGRLVADTNWHYMRSRDEPPVVCVYVDFPQVVRDMINGSSNVRLNFHVECSWEQDIERLILERRDWKHKEWEEAWRRRNWQCVGWPSSLPINPAPPLANHWCEILEEDQLPRQTKWREILEDMTLAIRDNFP